MDGSSHFFYSQYHSIYIRTVTPKFLFKGQLISKGLFGILEFLKKTGTETFQIDRTKQTKRTEQERTL